MKKRLNLLVLLLFIVIFGVIDSIEYILSKDFGIQMIGNVALYLFEIIVTILLVKVSSKGGQIMKKENLILFSKMLILYYVISAIAFVIVFFTIGKMPWLDVICDAFAGIGFAAVIICLCKSEEKETTDENMLKMFKHYNLKVYEKDGYMIGRFRGIRRLFFKDIEYRRGSNRITGPKNIISKYSMNQ